MISSKVQLDVVEELLRKLPIGKAPRPNSILNEALKEVCLELAKDLATVISGCLIGGIIPTSLKESTIIVLRKERK